MNSVANIFHSEFIIQNSSFGFGVVALARANAQLRTQGHGNFDTAKLRPRL